MTRVTFWSSISLLVLISSSLPACSHPALNGVDGANAGGGGGMAGAPGSGGGAVALGDCPTSCGPDSTCCEGVCVDLSTDVEHCGACAAACSDRGGTPSCEGGVCTTACEAGRADCDGEATNGCEDDDPGPPGDVQLLRPLLGAFTGAAVASEAARSLRPAFTWVAQAGACGDLTYQLQVDDSCPLERFVDCAFESPEVDLLAMDSRVVLDEDLPVSTAPPLGTRYFWRVRACDVFDRCSEWSRVRYLDVGRDRQDVTGDGYPDIVLQDEGHTGHYLLYAGGPLLGVGPTGGPTSIEPTRVLAEVGSTREFQNDHPPIVRFVGDVNGDGFQDFVADGPELDAVDLPVGEEPADAAVHCSTRLLYLGAPSVDEVRAVLFDTGTWAPGGLAHSFAAGDLDADGFADVWAAQSIESVASAGPYPAAVPGVFLFRGHAAVAAQSPTDPAAGTVVGEATDFEPSLSVRARPDDDGDFLGISVESGDFNGDGLVDAAIVAPAAHAIYLVLGGALDVVVDRAIPYGGTGATGDDCRNARLSVADFNADGFDDFAVNCAEQRIIEVYFGGDPLAESMTFEKLVNPDAAGSLDDTLAVDLDADGRFELVTGGGQNYAETTPSVWLFSSLTGSASDLGARALPLMGASGHFGAADHNGDGYTDLVVGGVMPAWIPGRGNLELLQDPEDPNVPIPPRYLSGKGAPLVTRVIGR